MKEIKLEELNPVVSNRLRPFIEDILKGYDENIHSIHIVGSAVTPDFKEKISDINSVVVLNAMDLRFIEFLAPLGKKYSKKGIAAPLIMTPEYMTNSLDTFPIEFLDMGNIHKTVYGEDIFKDIRIDNSHLRVQCEREIKTRLIGLRQGYISSLGNRELLNVLLSKSITGCMPLFRAVISLLEKEPPVERISVIKMFREVTKIDSDIFEKMLLLKDRKIKPAKEELNKIFEQYYSATETIGKIVDEIRL